MTTKKFTGIDVFVLLLVFLSYYVEIKGKINLVTSVKRRIIRSGQNLQINCTIFSGEFEPNLELKWQKVGSHFDIKSRQIANNTLQLQIQQVEVSDGGDYRCVVMRQSRVVNSTSVHVVVGDLPSKPHPPNWRSLNWHICFNWNPVSSTGGLPVTYKIQYRCLSDCELDDDDDDDILNSGWHEVCKNTLPTHGREMKCCLDHVTIFVKYEAAVVAENAAGSVTSSPVRFTRGIETILGPPQSLRAQATGYGAITIDWTPPPDASYWQIRYAILYHAQGDSVNKTITLDSNGQYHYRLTRLAPYTNYTIYVAGIGPLNSGVGIPVGPVVVQTKEENPSDAPKLTSWKSKVYPENPNRRNVTVAWKLPPKAKWNGRIRYFIIQYRKVSDQSIDINSDNPWGKTIRIDNSSKNKGTISSLLTFSAYEVDMQMCNGAGCGGIGNRVVIDGLRQLKQGERRNVYEGFVVVFIGLTITVLFLFALTVLVCFKVKSLKQIKVEALPKCYLMKRTSYDQMCGETAA